LAFGSKTFRHGTDAGVPFFKDLFANPRLTVCRQPFPTFVI